MVKNLEEYKGLGSIKDLPPSESEQYIEFLNSTYNDNLKASEFLLIKFPRWSIITGYYTMHDISKLFLAKKYNFKLSKPFVHAATIQALRELVKRKEILTLIEKAEKEYDQIITLHFALLQGKDEREKSQYYISSNIKPNIAIEKASFFLERLVKPYIKIINKLISDDN